MLVVPVFQLMCAFGLVFLACEFCGRCCYRFDGINDVVNQFDWYLFPIELQKSLPMIVNNAQQAFHFECFGSIPCDRETFQKVCLNSVLHISCNKIELGFPSPIDFTGDQLCILLFYGTASIRKINFNAFLCGSFFLRTILLYCF